VTYMNSNYNGCKKFLTLVLLVFSSMIYGCSMFQGGQVAIVPPIKRSDSFLHDLIRRGIQLDSVSIEGRLSLTINGKDHPSVKIRAWLVSKSEGSFVRIKGLAPLGVTVFDLLAKKDRAWIYLPRSGKVYKGNRFFTSYGSMDVVTAVKVIEMIINPWSPARYCDLKQTRCIPDTLPLHCFKAKFFDMLVTFEYLDDLSPRRFYSKGFQVSFEMEGGSGYPKKVEFYLDKANIKGELIVSKASFSPVYADGPLFDEFFFLQMLKRVKRP